MFRLDCDNTTGKTGKAWVSVLVWTLPWWETSGLNTKDSIPGTDLTQNILSQELKLQSKSNCLPRQPKVMQNFSHEKDDLQHILTA